MKLDVSQELAIPQECLWGTGQLVTLSSHHETGVYTYENKLMIIQFTILIIVYTHLFHDDHSIQPFLFIIYTYQK